MNNFCVYPGYGVCQVLGEEIKSNQNFLKLKSFLLGELTIFIPKNKESLSRMRPLINKEEAIILQDLMNNTKKPDKTFRNWNQKFRSYMSVLNSGDAKSICLAIQELKYESSIKELNYSAKKLLQSLTDCLSAEINITTQIQ